MLFQIWDAPLHSWGPSGHLENHVFGINPFHLKSSEYINVPKSHHINDRLRNFLHRQLLSTVPAEGFNYEIPFGPNNYFVHKYNPLCSASQGNGSKERLRFRLPVSAWAWARNHRAVSKDSLEQSSCNR